MRSATVTRATKETSIAVTVDLDGPGAAKIDTPVGFLSHMLEVIARHGQVDLDVVATGDTFIDYHHTVEDTGLTLGEAFANALGAKRGIRRFGATRLNGLSVGMSKFASRGACCAKPAHVWISPMVYAGIGRSRRA